MKKVLAALLSLSVLFAFCSCGGETDTNSSTPVSSNPASVVSTPAPVSTEEPVSTPEPVSSEEPVDEKDLVAQGTPIGDSVNEQYGGAIENAFDGNTATRWQSNAKGNNGDPGWIGLKWDEAKTFDTIYCHWEAAHPAADGFKIQISDDCETWTDVEFESVRTDTEADDNQKDTITFEPVTAKAVRVLCEKAYVGGKGVMELPSCYEMVVSNSADAEVEDTESSEAE